MNKLPIYRTEGIIIRTADLGELDRLISIYTKGYGKILARAISARKKESKLKGFLQNFTYARFSLAKSRTIDIVTDVEVIDTFSYLHNHLENLCYAFYFSELIDKLIAGPEMDENVWRLVLRAFEVLNEKRTDLPRIKDLFEDKFLEFLGHPTLAMRGKETKMQKLNYLQNLAGGRIRSFKFLGQCGVE
jgi:DNA repair protein RecO (recombination protein O)